MCGIVGILNRDGSSVDHSILETMIARVAHRGPDGRGSWERGPVGLGHRRLAIRDLSPSGAQPMADPSGRAIVTYNGEIYNDKILRRELERDYGMVFHSTCDAEVIPVGYLAWGDRVFDRLEGMFAVGLWDVERQRLVLARDAAGIKPLYVQQTTVQVRFASEIKALLVSSVSSPAIDVGALHAFMAQGYVAPDRSLLQGIAHLAPGTVRIIDRDGVTERRFWRPTRTPRIRDPREALDGFLDRWRVVVDDMTVSDVPIGVLQSSGVDSSLVTLQLRENGARVPLFTGGFTEHTYDEAGMARRIADAVGMPHHAIAIGADPEPEATFRAVVHHFDGQLADSSAYSVYRLTREVRRRVPVVLAGDGADEFFGGYPTYRASRIAAYCAHVVPPALAALMGRSLMAATGEERLSPAEIAGRFCLGLTASAGESHPEWRRLVPSHLLDDLYGPALRDLCDCDPLAGYRQALKEADGDLVDRCMLADQRFYLPADMLMKMDAMSMAHGLEVRVPFLDRRIMDFAAQLHPSLLTPLRGPDKKLLRQALVRYLSPSLISREKRGFNTPVAGLLRGGLSGLATRFFDTEPDALEPYFDADAVRRLWRAHRERRANHGYTLWALLTLGVWRETLSMSRPEPNVNARAVA